MTGSDPEMKNLVSVYRRFFCDEISRAEAMDIIGEEQWDRVSRVAAFRISNEGDQPVTNDELVAKYKSQ